jgi:hypothetical protein
MRYFPEDKAAVSGVLKAYLGLSSAVFQQVYATFVPFRPERDAGSSRENDASDRAARFVLLVAVVGGAAACDRRAVLPGPRGGFRAPRGRLRARRRERRDPTRGR